MATIQRVVAKALSRFDELTGSQDVEYMYSGLAPGDDIFREIDIPPLGDALRIKDTDLYLESYDHEPFVDNLGTTDGSGKVTCHYSATSVRLDEEFVRWEYTYKKETMRIPTFVLQPHYYVRAGEQTETKRLTWVEQGIVIPVEYSVLSVTVQRISHDLSERSAILDDMRAAKAQIGHLHVFPQFGSDQFVMQPFTARQADPYRVEMSFTWVSDPGNGPPRLPSNASADDKASLHFPSVPRPAWNIYQVIPAKTLGTTDSAERPAIKLVELYPQTLDNGPNPYYTPTGYKSLPGKPMG